VSAAAIEYVRRLAVMRVFYCESLGMTVKDSASEYCILESDEWTLSLVVARDARVEDVDVPPPVRRDWTPIKLGFRGHQIEAVRSSIQQLGGLLGPPGATWEFQNFARLDGSDPEGNVFQLLEPRPSPQS
jgi:hypothetical protein